MCCIGVQQADRFSRYVLALCSLLFLAATSAYASDPIWSAKLDDDLRFYQTTEMGVLIAGTEKSLYAVDSETGEVLWRRRNMRVDQTDLAPVVGTDLLLLSYEESGRPITQRAASSSCHSDAPVNTFQPCIVTNAV